jgi:hypothetical protein
MLDGLADRLVNAAQQQLALEERAVQRPGS